MAEGDQAFSIAVEASMAENELLTPAQVAVMFRVNPKTVTRWARAGRISAVRTLGGHRRFRAEEIRRFLERIQDAVRRVPYDRPGLRDERAVADISPWAHSRCGDGTGLR